MNRRTNNNSRILRDAKRKEKIRKGKLLFMGFTFSLVLCYLMARVIYIKAEFGDEYERKAVEQEFNKKNSESILTASRGSIYDRNNTSIAISYGVDKIFLDIREAVTLSDEEKEKLVTKLNEYLDIPFETLWRYLEVDENNKPIIDRNYFVIKENVDREVSLQLKESGVKCVYTEENSRRSYIHNNLAAQVIGFIRIGDSYGLERYYNGYLDGKNGKVIRTYDNNNSLVTTKIEAKDGYSIITTIDTEIQKYAEQAVKRAVETEEPVNASVIVMNPKTGEILAMAQDTTFNLNEPSNISYVNNEIFKSQYDYLSDEEQLLRLMDMWSNFNVSKSFEPGSIFKPIVVAAALEENIINTSSNYYCSGKKDIYGTEIPCWYRSGHGQQTLTQVLQNSCNIGMFDIISKMGSTSFYKYQKEFGFGEKTGIDLPAELSCETLLYTPSQLKNPVHLATSSMGQGFNSTPIQDINSFAAIINGGNLMKPYIVSQVVDNKGNVIKENSPQVIRKVISKETSNTLREMLKSVVTEEGTGNKGIIKGYSIGGKTGTAEQGKRGSELHTVSFIEYIPADDPEILAIGIIHLPKVYIDGVTSAVPMLTEVMTNIIKYKGIQPTSEVSEEDNISVEKGNIEMLDLTGLSTKEATKYLNEQVFDYEIVGNGNYVTSHSPSAGTQVSPGSKIYLYVSYKEEEGELVFVPKVVGVSVEKAADILTNAGLSPIIFEDVKKSNQSQTESDYSNYQESENNADSENKSNSGMLKKAVYEQMPSAESEVQLGTEIKLKVR